MKKILWRMKDGQAIDIQEMEESHINNCIAMLKRQIQDPWDVVGPDGLNSFVAHQIDEKNVVIGSWIKIFRYEINRRGKTPHIELNGDMAQMLYDQMLEEEYENMDDIEHPMDRYDAKGDRL